MFLCHNVLDFIVPISYPIIYHKAQGEYHCKGEYQFTLIQILIADTGRQTMCAELHRIHLLFVTNTILYLNVHRPCLLLLITWNWHLHHFVHNRLLGLTDGFYDEIKTLPLEEDAPEQMDYIDTIRERKKSNKRKVF